MNKKLQNLHSKWKIRDVYTPESRESLANDYITALREKIALLEREIKNEAIIESDRNGTPWPRPEVEVEGEEN